MAIQFIYLFIFIIHLLSSFYFGRWLQFQNKENRSQGRTWKWMGFIFSFFMPIFGMIGLLVVYQSLKHLKQSDTKPLNIRFDDHLQKDSSKDTEEIDFSQVLTWKEIKEVQPIVDIFNTQDIELQKGAIDSLAKEKNPESIKILKDVLEYAIPEVRYFIVEALSKISKYFGDKILLAKSELNKNPSSTANITNLADCYYEYAISNVEDDSLSNYYFKEATKYYKQVLELDYNNTPLILKYLEVIKKTGKYQEALEVFNKLKFVDIKDNIYLLFTLMEIYFHLRMINKVKLLAQQIRKSGYQIPENINQVIALWN